MVHDFERPNCDKVSLSSTQLNYFEDNHRPEKVLLTGERWCAVVTKIRMNGSLFTIVFLYLRQPNNKGSIRGSTLIVSHM